MSPVSNSEEDSLYDKIDRYSWDSDADFQSGLVAILGSDPSSQQANELELRARCFYYERKFNVPVDFDAYKQWREAASAGRSNGPSGHGVVDDDARLAQGEVLPGIAPFTPNRPGTVAGVAETGDDGQGAAPYPTSFAQIVDLISSGKPIPGIKEIPDTVLDGQGTESKREKRRKPWEKDTG